VIHKSCLGPLVESEYGFDSPTGGRASIPAMLFFIEQFRDNPEALLAYVAAFGLSMVVGIAFHEFSHAWAAYELGDNTAASQGRLTLNPVRHLDPLGTILLFVVGLGWGRPTPVNPYNLRGGARRGNALVALAGPLSNLVFAAIAALPFRLGVIDSIASLDDIRNASSEEIIGLLLFFVVFINVILGVFNLIPIHPLDGFKIALGILPPPLGNQLAALAPWGPGLLMGLIIIGFITPFNPIGMAISSAAEAVLYVIT